MLELIIAIDPGREKCGIAVVHKHDGALSKNVINTAELANIVQELATSHNINTVVIGDRTASRSAQKTLSQISANGQPLTIIPVDEHHSTDNARQRYWRDNPPRGFKRLIPVTMQVPPIPVDDYVAVILAERYFAGL